MVPDTVRDDLASIPTRRIVRYALYALAVVALGPIAVEAAFFVFDLAQYPLYFLPVGSIDGWLYDHVLLPLTDVIQLFSYLLAAGVFLSQFERGD